MLTPTPFRIILRATSPVVLSDFAPTLDSLLYEALEQRYANASTDEVLDRMKEVLCYDSDIGVFHGSALKFGITGESGLVGKTLCRLDSHNQDKLSTSMFTPNGKNGKYKRVVLSGGPTKVRVNSYPAYFSPYYIFDGYGDETAIVDNLNFFHVGVGYNAREVGFGSFSDVLSFSTDVDISIREGNHVNRPLPNSVCLCHSLEGNLCAAALVPPYFSENLTECLVPDRVRIEDVKNYIDGETQ